VRNNNQRGIAIGPILYIVAILAVLVSAIAAGSGAFNGDTSAVKAKAQASAILGYVNELQIGVDRVLSRCPDTEISLANSVDSGYVENPLAPADKSCHVFDVNGGGVLFKEPPADVDLTGVPQELRHYFINANVRVYGSGNMPSDTGGNSGRDLIIILPGIKRELCLKINDMVDVSMESGDAPNGGGIQAMKESDYWSSLSSGWTVVCGSGSNQGKPHCCIKVSNNTPDPQIPIGSYVFFHVLHVR
jgi:hypothetical protein